MAKKLCGLVLFLVLVVTHEFMVMEVEGRLCHSKSKKYHGRLCYFGSQSRNCKSICKIKEGFVGGQCVRGACICNVRCGSARPQPPPSGGSDQGDEGNNGGGGGEGGDILIPKH